MGLGIPWIIAAIYHAIYVSLSPYFLTPIHTCFLSFQNPEKGFQVKAGALSFSVVLYTICAILGIGLIMLRRFLPCFGQAELGGPKGTGIITSLIQSSNNNLAFSGAKYASSFFLIFLWISYVVLSSLQTYGHINNPLAL